MRIGAVRKHVTAGREACRTMLLCAGEGSARRGPQSAARLGEATRDTERVETRVSYRKQSAGYASTRDSSRRLNFRRFFAATMWLKGGTAFQPLTHVSHRKEMDVQIQGRNVPVHLLMHDFSTLASNIQPLTSRTRNVPVNLLDRESRRDSASGRIASSTFVRARCAMPANRVAYGHSVDGSLP